MTTPDWNQVIVACIANGDRLADDAATMFDRERGPSAFALSILAQEEYAKAFLLLLVDAGALPWSAEVRGALRDHLCKQLVTVLLDYLCPEIEEFIRRHDGKTLWGKLPNEVVDAIHVIVHERIPRDRSRSWLAPDERPLDDTVKGIARGKTDRKKQDAIYVDVGQTGQVDSTPVGISTEDAAAELERARRMGSDLHPHGSDGRARLPPHADSAKLADIFRLLNNQLSPTEFAARWRSV